MISCLIIIPAYNEEKNLGEVLRGIADLNIDVDILVINDGSSDNTEGVAKASGVNVITIPSNLGYGGACQKGFLYAKQLDYKFVIQFDADGQHDPDDIILILEKLESDSADIVIGSRFLGRGNFKAGFFKLIAIYIFRLLIKIATGVYITDPSSGLQGLTKRTYTYYSTIGNYSTDYPDADILINMIFLNFRVLEFPANIKRRISGKSMHSGIKPIFYFVKMFISIFIVLVKQRFGSKDLCTEIRKREFKV